MADRGAQSRLMAWVKERVEGYEGVKIDNFHMSFKNGLGTSIC